MKLCPLCNESKTLESFYRSSASKDGRNSYCIPCAKEYFAKRNKDGLRKRQPNEKEWRRRANLKLRFGLTEEQYAERLDSQGGECATCGKKATKTTKAFAVDHDHSCCPGKITCGKCVRGILCSNCNTALGMVQDDPKTLRKLAEYVQLAYT